MKLLHILPPNELSERRTIGNRSIMCEQDIYNPESNIICRKQKNLSAQITIKIKLLIESAYKGGKRH